MHKFVKKLLLGFVIWLVPFVVSFFVWDVEAGGPSIPQDWFSGLMMVSLAIGFGIAAHYWFREFKGKKDIVAFAWLTGFVWFVELILLDTIFLVGVFGNSTSVLGPISLAYLGVWILTGTMGHVLKN